MKNYLIAFVCRAVLSVLVLSLISTFVSAGQVRRPGPIPLGRPAPCCSITAINTATGVVLAKENATGRNFQFKVNDATLLNSLKIGQGVYANFTTNQVSLDGSTNCCAIIPPPLAPSTPVPAAAPAPAVNRPAAIPATSPATTPTPGAPATAAPPLPTANKPVTSPAPAGAAPAPPVNRPAIGPASAPASGVAPAAVGVIQNRPTPLQPCCNITAINASNSVVTAKDNATGSVFQFNLNDATQLNSLQIGQGVYANFAAKMVSLNGNTPAGTILATQPASLQPSAAAPAPTATGPATNLAAAPGAAPAAVGQIQNKPTPGAPCCAITAVNTGTGVVTAKDNATGSVFQFNLNDATQLNSLQIGQGVYANFAARMVSLNGNTPAGTIIATQPAMATNLAAGPGAAPAAVGQIQNKPTPVTPCCSITALNTTTGVVIATESATGRSITFQIAHFQPVDGARLSQSFPVGGPVDFQPVDGAAVTSGSNVRLTVPGFQPVDGIVASIGTAATSAAAPMAAGQIQNRPRPLQPCCAITATNTRTGVVTATESATGRSITFQIARFQPVDGAKLSQTFAVGSKVDFQPVDGAAVTSGSNVRLTVPGFQPVDGIVASIGTAAAAAGVAQQGVPRDVRTPQSAGGNPSSTSVGIAHTAPGAALRSPGLPTVTAGTPQRLQGGLQQVPSGNLVRYGSSGSRVNQDVVHLRGAADIQQVTGLPDGAKNLLLLHVNTLAPGEVDHYIVNKKLAADWIAAHPALAKVKPPASHDSGAGCSVTLTNPCLGADVQHITDQTSQQINNLLDAGRKEWQQVTHELSHDLQMVETCFADQTLSLHDVPVDISPSDVPDLTFRFDKGGKPNSAAKANNQFGAITGSANVTGTLTFGLPMDAHFKAGVDMFWIECLPFFIRPKNIHADGTFALGTKIGAELTATGQFTQEFNIAAGRIPIALIPIVIAGIPIAEMDVSAYMEGKVLVDGNGRLDAQFSLETQRQTNDFDFVCSGHGCVLNSHGGATRPETTSESVKLDGRIHVKPEIYTALQLDLDFDALTARAGPQPYLLGEVYACGAASGTQTAGAPSTSQDSYALTADLDWGIDLRAEALVGGALVGDRAISKLLKPRHLAFWDLAHSTALLPRADGLTQAAMGTPAVYKIKMPACYPYPDKVKYQVSWTGGATASNGASGTTVASGGSAGGSAASRSLVQKGGGLKAGGAGAPATSNGACNLQSGQGSCEFDPLKDFSLDLAWPSAGNYNLTVTAVGDTPHGREYSSAQATTVNVTVGAPGSTSSSGSNSTTSAATPGTPPTPAASAPSAGTPVAKLGPGAMPAAVGRGMVSPGPALQKACCTITAINANSAVVTGKENPAGRIFQFKTDGGAVLHSLSVGEGIYANFGDMQVSLNGSAPIGTIITGDTAYSGFDPTTQGFNFTNYFTGDILIDIPLFGTRDLGATYYGLCGGMTYAALDNFLSGGTIPNDQTAPISGTHLRSYLYDRQHDTFVADNGWMVRRFVEWVAHPDTTANGITGLDVLSDQELEGTIRPQLAAGHPVPLGVVKANISVNSFTSLDNNVLIENHQVLAIGYELHNDTVRGTHWDIRIYDPNFPDTIQRMHTHSNVAGYQTEDASSNQTDSFRGFFATPYSPKQPYWVSGGQTGHGVAIAERGPTQAGAVGTNSNQLVTGNLQRFTPPPPDPNPNHLPDLVPDMGSGFGECSIPAGSSCQAACGSKKVPTNFGVHNLTQYPATGSIRLILKKVGSSAPDQTWTVDGLGGNQWAYPGGYYTMWNCPTSEGSSNPADNYTLEVQGPPQLTNNNKVVQLYIPPNAVRCAGGVDWSGCQQ